MLTTHLYFPLPWYYPHIQTAILMHYAPPLHWHSWLHEGQNIWARYKDYVPSFVTVIDDDEKVNDTLFTYQNVVLSGWVEFSKDEEEEERSCVRLYPHSLQVYAMQQGQADTQQSGASVQLFKIIQRQLPAFSRAPWGAIKMPQAMHL